MGRGNSVVVLGVGRFGSSLARELMRLGCDVMAVDRSETLIQEVSSDVTRAAIADTTDVESLRQLGVGDYGHAVVAIGSFIEASILTVAALTDVGITDIWAKAVSRQHGRILSRVGATHVVLPEHEMGERVAHLVTGRLLDYIEFDEDFAMIKTPATKQVIGVKLADAGIRSKYKLTVVAYKRGDGAFVYATSETVLEKGDVLVIAGKPATLEKFAGAQP